MLKANKNDVLQQSKLSKSIVLRLRHLAPSQCMPLAEIWAAGHKVSIMASPTTKVSLVDHLNARTMWFSRETHCHAFTAHSVDTPALLRPTVCYLVTICQHCLLFYSLYILHRVLNPFTQNQTLGLIYQAGCK